MHADDRDAIERLDAYLDALATHHPAPPPTDLVWVDITQYLQALDRTPAPSPTFAARLLEELMPTPMRSQTWGRLSPPVPNGRVHEPWSTAPPPCPLTTRRWTRAHLGSAAILVLLIIASVFALDPGHLRQREASRVTLPAVIASPADQTAVVMDTLLEVTTADLPAGHQIIGLERLTLQPGSAAMTVPAMEGIVVIAPETGELVAMHGGTETPLQHDAPLIARHQAVALQATGPEAGSAVVVYVISAFVDATSFDSDPLVHRMDRLIETSANDLPGGTARIVVERLTLPAGSALPAQDAQPWLWTEVEDGTLGLTLTGDRLPFRWTSGTERTFQLGQYLPPIHPGTQLTIRNAGASPLILNRLTILPQAAGPAAGTPLP